MTDKTVQEMVTEFHQAFGHPHRLEPMAVLPDAEKSLRAELIEEEFNEYIKAVNEADIVEVADALADIVYVVYGAALCHGIDLDAILRVVHESNMSKLGANGKPIYDPNTGKVLKPADWEPPKIKEVL